MSSRQIRALEKPLSKEGLQMLFHLVYLAIKDISNMYNL